MKTIRLFLMGFALFVSAINAQPLITNQPTSQTNLAGASITFSVGVNGTGPFTYQWQLNGTNLASSFITTVAGNATAAYSGDGLAAPNSSLSSPLSVVSDAFGNFYIADEVNNRIRKVDTNGIITTFAGNGNIGHSGDNDVATNAMLAHPWGIVLDGAGNLYIADEGQQADRIRKVDTNGIITTYAGNGITGYTGDGGAATNAEIGQVLAVALDAVGNLYFVDNANQRIRKVDTNGIITTVAGNGTIGFSGNGAQATNASFEYPHGIASDASGILFIADHFNNRIRKVNTNGIITTFAGNGVQGYSGDGGAATSAALNLPNGLGLDAAGNLYIADNNSSRIRKVDTNGIITTVAGSIFKGYAGNGGNPTNAFLNAPWGVSADNLGNLYIADSGNNCIRKITVCTQPTLMLSDIDARSAGNYTVVVSNFSGSITSAIAALTVTIPTTPPLITSGTTNFGFVSNQFGFNISRAFGQTIVVEVSTNLVNWTPLLTNTADNSPLYFVDLNSTNRRGFYRIKLP